MQQTTYTTNDGLASRLAKTIEDRSLAASIRQDPDRGRHALCSVREAHVNDANSTCNPVCVSSVLCVCVCACVSVSVCV